MGVLRSSSPTVQAMPAPDNKTHANDNPKMRTIEIVPQTSLDRQAPTSRGSAFTGP